VRFSRCSAFPLQARDSWSVSRESLGHGWENRWSKNGTCFPLVHGTFDTASPNWLGLTELHPQPVGQCGERRAFPCYHNRDRLHLCALPSPSPLAKLERRECRADSVVVAWTSPSPLSCGSRRMDPCRDRGGWYRSGGIDAAGSCALVPIPNLLQRLLTCSPLPNQGFSPPHQRPRRGRFDLAEMSCDVRRVLL
jgi:hypothetical protein